MSAAAEERRVFVNAVDDPVNATAFLTGVVRRSDVTIAISSEGRAPALTSLLREALDAVLPRDLGAWLAEAPCARHVRVIAVTEGFPYRIHAWQGQKSFMGDDWVSVTAALATMLLRSLGNRSRIIASLGATAERVSI